MRQLIVQVVEAGGYVVHPYKEKIPDWHGEVKVGRLSPMITKDAPWFVSVCGDIERFDTADAAVDFYMRKVFRRKNIALAYRGIHLHKLTEEWFDDLSVATIRRLIKKYNAEFFATDYPFAEENA